MGLLSFVVFNANLRSIAAGDTFPARYLPFAILHDHTVRLDPVRSITAQGRGSGAFWMIELPNGHAVSLYPVVLPVLVSPLYVPAVAYLDWKGWDTHRLDRIARVMEKLVASLLAALSVVLMHALLVRRAPTVALPLALVFGFGTTVWVICSQALWQHTLAVPLLCAALLVLTGPSGRVRAIAAGLLCGLLAGNRPPDALLAIALAIHGLRWADRNARTFVVAASVPVLLVFGYNLRVAGHPAGGYGIVGEASFLEHDLVAGLAGTTFSPMRGLFVFSPFLLFLPLCLRGALRDEGTRRLTVGLAVACLAQWLLYAKADWRGGASWGPRWLTDLLPVLVWMMAPGVARLRGAARAGFAITSLAATAIQTIGAFWYVGIGDLPLYAHASERRWMPAAWNVRNTPFLVERSHPPAAADLLVRAQGSLDEVSLRDRRGSGLPDTLEVSGWALADGQSPHTVAVWLDGLHVATTQRFEFRADVASTLGEWEPSGWHVEAPLPGILVGDHTVGVTLHSSEWSDSRFVDARTIRWVRTPATQQDPLPSAETASAARRAAELLAARQRPEGYWITSYTSAPRFEDPKPEMNVFLTSLLVDLLRPIAKETGLGDSVERARQHLAGQIESDGLVRYHGRPDAPTIGTLGCRITPDTDDTALVWRIAPSPRGDLLPRALAEIARYRTPGGLHRTWLAPRDRFECIDPGKDPNPPDVAIQMNVLLLLASADPSGARQLCDALGRAIDDDRIWVYYAKAPLVPMLRRSDLRRSGCAITMPESTRRRAAPGQQIWLDVLDALDEAAQGRRDVPAIAARLASLAADDFAAIRANPPLLYHNDLSASVRRFYWSEDAGYALWLRLHREIESRASHPPAP